MFRVIFFMLALFLVKIKSSLLAYPLFACFGHEIDTIHNRTHIVVLFTSPLFLAHLLLTTHYSHKRRQQKKREEGIHVHSTLSRSIIIS